MEFGVLLNYLRFFASFAGVFFAASPLAMIGIMMVSTIVYSIIAPFCKGTCDSVIAHKCISHVPSTILLVLSSYYSSELRSVFLVAGGLQYLNIWVQMYSDVLTKELRSQILAKKGPSMAEEGAWLLSDVTFT